MIVRFPAPHITRAATRCRQAFCKREQQIAELMTDATGGSFAGTDRYQINGILGAGGMGVVYDAFDRERNVRVALKTLKALDPRALFRFKQEFRSLAGIDHRNLIHLHELVADDDVWFFTMDYVPGQHLMDYVRPDDLMPESIADAQTLDELAPGTPDEQSAAGQQSASRREPLPDGTRSDDPHPPGCDLVRLRNAFGQLAEGLYALHSAGKLHRDIKPPNVLVEDDGHVVLLDFGLVVQMEQSGQPELGELPEGSPEKIESSGIYQTLDQSVSGTAAYMVPEQALNRPLGESSDWYAVGTMLFKALTGQLPFQGGLLKLLRRKIREQAPDPADLAPNIPEDLRQLCLDLMARNPDDRPTGHDVLERLSVTALTQEDLQSASEIPFVGREAQLNAMHEAFRGVLVGRTFVVEVDGLSGMGKSALVDQFLKRVQQEHDAIVLCGRCYEQESVPYKGIDSLVDELTRFLLRLPVEQTDEILVEDISLLARLFPVLRQVKLIDERVLQSDNVGDPRAMRHRAFVALKELLHRIGQTRPLILSLDDLQWGDADSAILLNEVLQSDPPPQVMLVLAFRGEYVDTSPCLKTLREAKWRRRSRAPVASPGSLHVSDSRSITLETIRLRPLGSEDVRELVAQVLPADQSLSDDAIEQIVQDSGGSPYFVQELVRWIGLGRKLSSPDDSIAGLDAVLHARACELPQSARSLLNVIAVAGRPIAMRHAFRASELVQIEPRSLKPLYSGHFIRSTGTGLDDEVATFHDRIRESVSANIDPPTRSRLYGNLAASLVTDESTDPEMLADCYYQAHDLEQAGRYYEKAAQIASDALAFSRAAHLYRRALEFSPERGASRLSLRRKLADALANAGLGTAAADEYQAVSTDCEGREQLVLEGLAAFHYCTGARIGRGRRLLQRALGRIGFKLPDSPTAALMALGWQRMRHWYRGNRFRQKTIDEVDPRDLLKIDIAWNASKALSLFDTISGASVLAKALRLALNSGEPTRIATLLAWEAGVMASSRFRFELRQSEALLKLAREVAVGTDDPYCLGMVELATACRGLCMGNFELGVQHARSADRIFRTRCTGVAWERDSSQIFLTWSLAYRGLFTELAPYSEVALLDAQDRGDVYAATTQAVFSLAWARLAAGDPDGAEEALELNLARWSKSGFHIQHYLGAAVRSMISIYRGRPEDAFDGLTNHYRDMKKSLLFEVRIAEIGYFAFRGRAAVAALFDDRMRTELARSARRDANRLARMKIEWATPQSDAILAGLASVDGDGSETTRLLRRATDGFDKVGMEAWAAACRIRLGQVLPNDEGNRLRTQGEEWMRIQNVASIPRMTAALVPGFEDPEAPAPI